jgi:hypothetical protein
MPTVNRIFRSKPRLSARSRSTDPCGCAHWGQTEPSAQRGPLGTESPLRVHLDLTHECTRAINRLRSLLLAIFPAPERVFAAPS